MSNSPALNDNLTTVSAAPTDTFGFERRLFLILAAVALLYSLVAGLRTVADPDLGWQMATGRWVVQHHQVPTGDVFSYTAHGQPWIYPVGAGILFYGAYLTGGFALISWMGALACCGTIALLLRRGSAITAALAVMAVYPIAARTSPRAEMFTVVLFAAFLSLLWENYQTGKAALWLLPWLMFAWVNLHLGFVSGLGLLAAYVGLEVSETIFSAERRQAAVQRLRQASVYMACTAFATLLNPWGWQIYRAIVRQERAMSQQQTLIMEWASLPLHWNSVSSAFWLRQNQGAIYQLLIIAAIAAGLALLQSQLGAAILLLGAAYPAVRHVRMGALFVCVAVIVGGAVLTSAALRYGRYLGPVRVRRGLAIAAVVLLAGTACVRSYDMVTNRYYFQSIEASTFGAGLGWWFPQGAADFIQRHNLPGEIFNTYDEGGYVAWRLGPERLDYVDGRAIPFGNYRILRSAQLMQVSPDSADWQQEANRYNINTILLPLGRFDAVRFSQLKAFCNSRDWRPVYLDENSAVFLRNRPETQDFIQRARVDCATAPLPATSIDYSPATSFNQWANAATLLAVLGRSSEALTASENALAIFPDSGFLHWLRGDVFSGQGLRAKAEQEYLMAVALEPGEATWSALASLYQEQGKIPQALHAREQAVKVSARPNVALLKLANFYIQVGQPKAALDSLDKAMRNAPADELAATGRSAFKFQIAHARSLAWEALGDVNRATASEEEAVQIAPDAADSWTHLAKLYQMQGRFQDVYRAEAKAAALGSDQKR